MEVPKDLLLKLRVLNGAKGNELMRNALKSAQRPPVKSLKGMVRRIKDHSDQSTGATFRAISQKVSFPSKKTPGRGYMLAGIDWEYLEKHHKTTRDIAARSGQKKFRRFTGTTNTGRRARGVNQKLTKKYVISYQKRSLRKYKGQTSQRNRPGAYWHILEGGWKNRRVKRPWSGYKFVEKAFRDTKPEMFKAFFGNLQGGMEREFKK